MSEFTSEELNILSYALTAILHNKIYYEQFGKSKIKDLFKKVIDLDIEIKEVSDE